MEDKMMGMKHATIVKNKDISNTQKRKGIHVLFISKNKWP